MKRNTILASLAFRKLFLKEDGFKRANFLRDKGIIKMGKHCYFHPINIPSEPELVSFHNNVIVAADVKFYTHDIAWFMFEYAQNDRDSFGPYREPIEVFDNVFIGADSIILPGVKIGPNAVIGAGSVVTKNVKPDSIVGGSPAKKIGEYETLLKKRKLQHVNDPQ